ncbi:unnamed protein product [Schistocephalus solidus]|uniref:Uncharacterized protein n=1 Tax=Schistocephalus solidus TaxID=70667 RepID=A0A183SBT1_SCHSO|nr:unnamed protein product [Schistocephalus solidus]
MCALLCTCAQASSGHSNACPLPAIMPAPGSASGQPQHQHHQPQQPGEGNTPILSSGGAIPISSAGGPTGGPYWSGGGGGGGGGCGTAALASGDSSHGIHRGGNKCDHGTTADDQVIVAL